MDVRNGTHMLRSGTTTTQGTTKVMNDSKKVTERHIELYWNVIRPTLWVLWLGSRLKDVMVAMSKYYNIPVHHTRSTMMYW